MPGSDALLLYAFLVDQDVKGSPPREVTVRAAALTDSVGTPIGPDVAVGVLASRDGDVLVASSCTIVDPGALLSEADEPRGGPIKLALGVVILLAVVGYSVVRLRRRRATEETAVPD